jgi:hypothetical protein
MRKFLWSLHSPPGVQNYAEFTVAALWRKKQIVPLYLARFKVSMELYHTSFLSQSMDWLYSLAFWMVIEPSYHLHRVLIFFIQHPAPLR